VEVQRWLQQTLSISSLVRNLPQANCVGSSTAPRPLHFHPPAANPYFAGLVHWRTRPMKLQQILGLNHPFSGISSATRFLTLRSPVCMLTASSSTILEKLSRTTPIGLPVRTQLR